MGIGISGDALRKFEYAQKHIDGWVSSALGDQAHSFIPYAKAEFRANFTTRTGQTESDIVAWHSRRESRKNGSVWFVRPVYHGEGRVLSSVYNYLYRWIPGSSKYSGTDREFMERAYARFVKTVDTKRYISDKIGGRFNALT